MLLLYAAGKLFSSSAPEVAMASCQEGQAYTVAGMARNTASASTANLTTTFFMTIFLLRLFYPFMSRLASTVLCQGGYRWYSIQYTTTPVMDTYSQSGNVQRAMRTWLG